MKKAILLIIIAGLGFSLNAQKQVKVKLNHKMNGVAFSLNTETKNSIGNKIQFTRVQYYLCNFKIVHDGGQETVVPDSHYLVDASINNELDLGTHNVTTIEKIIFSVGVDGSKNHLDPSKYPSSHALAPKSPSMHWGWTSGYRFTAIEGKSGSTLSKFWEIHSLFDKYFHTIYLPTAASEANNILTITLNADYAKSISKVDVSGGLIVHGEEGLDLIVLDNFRDSVFSNESGVLGIDEIEKPILLSYPSPNTSGQFYFNNEVKNKVREIKITNALGTVVKNIEVNKIDTSFELTENGIYFLTYTLNNGKIQSQKVVLTK